MPREMQLNRLKVYDKNGRKCLQQCSLCKKEGKKQKKGKKKIIGITHFMLNNSVGKTLKFNVVYWALFLDVRN